MDKCFLRAAWVAVALLGAPGARAGVKLAQDFALVQGWNAVYVTVASEESADEVFGAWPVNSVGAYDPASFLETKQFSGEGSTEGTSRRGFFVWHRGNPGLTDLRGVAANWVYVCFATNAWSGTLYGRPAAPRMTWHPTMSGNEAQTLNYMGVSAAPGRRVTFDRYASGLDVGKVRTYRLNGVREDKPSISPLSVGTLLAHGDVVMVESDKVSEWGGVLHVAPAGGVDFSTNLTRRVVTVRNDGATARTVRMALETASQPGQPVSPPLGLQVRDAGVYTNGWCAFGLSEPFERRFAAGEAVTLELAIDRTQLAGAAGTAYGGLLVFTDEEEDGSGMRVVLPLEVTSDGGAASGTAWPQGLWYAVGALDEVTWCRDAGAEEGVKAGGTMKVRLPMYVDANGRMTLLQRFVFGTDTNGCSHVYSADKENAFPVPIGDVKRVASVVLPIDQPKIGVETAAGSRFGDRAVFPFVVGERSPVNPMRHAYHPSHDGLQWDFETPAPSGDDVQNYVSRVKPEVFSITNRIVFTWDRVCGTAWSPEETLSGDLAWTLGGVRRQEIRMGGRFTMKRISAVHLDE